MPLSNPDHISTVIRLALGFQPMRVLDVGVGIGAYGLLLRQYLDISHESIRKSEWRATIEGVEIFEPYRNPVWAYAYDTVHMGDIRTVLPTLGRYDLVICNDVLEHFTLAEAQTLTRALLAHTDILIAECQSSIRHYLNRPFRTKHSEEIQHRKKINIIIQTS
jgi:2-polyprenyl-3-methyl-5-hydroxy-6-metoxy-1,4-benzoquinol methylase